MECERPGPGRATKLEWPELALTAYVFLLILVLSFRSIGLNPLVPDEWFYNLYTRLVSYGAAENPLYPSHLFFAVFKITGVCGTGFLDCARLLNAVAFGAGTVFVYLTACRFCSKRVALTVAMLSGLAPVSTYTAYFMPESMYYLSFWVLTWFALTRPTTLGKAPFGVTVGFLLGIASLVKAHALFLIPGFCIFMVFAEWRAQGPGRLVSRIGVCGYFLVSVLATKLLLGLALSGWKGFSLFGPVYSTIGTSLLGDELLDLASHGIALGLAHILGVLVLFSLPLAILVTGRWLRADDRQRANLSVYTIWVLLPLIALAALYTAKAGLGGGYETFDRIHMRYYNFAFPLLILIAAVEMTDKSSATSSVRARAVIAVLLGIGVLYVAPGYLGEYRPNLIDSPELNGLMRRSALHLLYGFVLTVSVCIWVVNVRYGAGVFLFLFMPSMLMTATYATHEDGRSRLEGDAYDSSGRTAAKLLGRAEAVVFVGTDRASLYRALLAYDNADAQVVAVERGGSVTKGQIPEGTESIVIVGDVSYLGESCSAINGSGFKIIRLVCGKMDFRIGGSRSGLRALTGIAEPEDWGAWSVGDVVRIRFMEVLPREFELQLKGRAFGPNEGLPVRISVGDDARDIPPLHWDVQGVRVSFSTDGATDEIRIDIPKPTSPKELGVSADERRLGIGIQELRIVPAARAD